MTSKLTREELRKRAKENINNLRFASKQRAFESARKEIPPIFNWQNMHWKQWKVSHTVSLKVSVLEWF